MHHLASLSRRSLLGFGATAVGLALAPKVWAQAAAPAAPAGPFSLPKRAYEAAALEPNIDATTMDIHYNRHHAAYVAGLNAAVKDHGVLAQTPLQQLLGDLGKVPEGARVAVRNAGGGHAN
ncbi:MAG: superoxide dismutase, partial [Bosea sp.]|nr:superoxide dismutase [Bosea sp. (in: a-proteobacteria)]